VRGRLPARHARSMSGAAQRQEGRPCRRRRRPACVRRSSRLQQISGSGTPWPAGPISFVRKLAAYVWVERSRSSRRAAKHGSMRRLAGSRPTRAVQTRRMNMRPADAVSGRRPRRASGSAQRARRIVEVEAVPSRFYEVARTNQVSQATRARLSASACAARAGHRCGCAGGDQPGTRKVTTTRSAQRRYSGLQDLAFAYDFGRPARRAAR